SLLRAVGEVQPTMSKALFQEPDQIPSRKAIVVGVVSIIAFAIGILASIALLVRRGPIKPPPPAASAIGQREIGIVYQRPFSQPDIVSRREPQKGRLHSYGWVDRKRGIVHIPIERAMERLLAEQPR